MRHYKDFFGRGNKPAAVDEAEIAGIFEAFSALAALNKAMNAARYSGESSDERQHLGSYLSGILLGRTIQLRQLRGLQVPYEQRPIHIRERVEVGGWEPIVGKAPEHIDPVRHLDYYEHDYSGYVYASPRGLSASRSCTGTVIGLDMSRTSVVVAQRGVSPTTEVVWARMVDEDGQALVSVRA